MAVSNRFSRLEIKIKEVMLRAIAGLAFTVALLPAQNQLDGNKNVFTVLAAINAAGYDAGLDSPSDHPLRKAVRAEIARLKPSSIPAIKEFMRQHRQESPAAELRQYVAWALLVDGPPKFAFKYLSNELPPDIAALADLGPLIEKFRTEARIDELWIKSQPAIDQLIERYHEPVLRTVQGANAYLRVPINSSNYMGRNFQIVVDLLGAPNQIQLHSVLDEYSVFVTNSTEPQINDVRTAYLHFLLDPLATKFATKLEEKKALGDYALGSPILAEHYKSDFLLLATRSLIKAVESRILYSNPARQASHVEEAMKEGFILTAHFAEQLPAYEKQEQAMRLYFPELIAAIDLKREEKRLESFEFSNAKRIRLAKPAPKPAAPELSDDERKLNEAEDLYAGRELDRAREAYLAIAERSAEKKWQAKAYYGLARIAALKKDPELAEKLFLRTLELEPEPQVRAWSLVYLGRLSDAAGDRERAVQNYRTALAVEGASEGARRAAEQGIKK
jgi:tetratricopeptide (TPR) repeat protein